MFPMRYGISSILAPARIVSCTYTYRISRAIRLSYYTCAHEANTPKNQALPRATSFISIDIQPYPAISSLSLEQDICRITSDTDMHFGANLKKHDVSSRIAVSGTMYWRVQVLYRSTRSQPTRSLIEVLLPTWTQWPQLCHKKLIIIIFVCPLRLNQMFCLPTNLLLSALHSPMLLASKTFIGPISTGCVPQLRGCYEMLQGPFKVVLE